MLEGRRESDLQRAIVDSLLQLSILVRRLHQLHTRKSGVTADTGLRDIVLGAEENTDSASSFSIVETLTRAALDVRIIPLDVSNLASDASLILIGVSSAAIEISRVGDANHLRRLHIEVTSEVGGVLASEQLSLERIRAFVNAQSILNGLTRGGSGNGQSGTSATRVTQHIGDIAVVTSSDDGENAVRSQVVNSIVLWVVGSTEGAA